MNETDFVNLLKKHLPGYFHKTHGSIYSAGLPDLIGVFNGLFVGIECKVGNNKVTDSQRLKLEKIAMSGGLAYEFLLKDEKVWITSYLGSTPTGISECLGAWPAFTLSRNRLWDLFTSQGSEVVERWQEFLQRQKSCS